MKRAATVAFSALAFLALSLVAAPADTAKPTAVPAKPALQAPASTVKPAAPSFCGSTRDQAGHPGRHRAGPEDPACDDRGSGRARSGNAGNAGNPDPGCQGPQRPGGSSGRRAARTQAGQRGRPSVQGGHAASARRKPSKSWPCSTSMSRESPRARP